MKLSIRFEEILAYAEKHYSVRPQIKYIDPRTIEVGYKPSVFIPSISMKIRVEAMRKDIVCLSYEGSKAAELLISGFVAHFEDKQPRGVAINAKEQRIDIYLEQVEQLEKVLSQVEPESIAFAEDGASISFHLRGYACRTPQNAPETC